ncbi:MAG: metallophosphoesterase [Planctomycetes bacterium]|nr:metallophosphoesterase [Planctomycetota bacterium]
MIAIISDIHSNREALDAVFAHIDAQGSVREVICLGDVIGYGAEPEYCVDVVRSRCDVVLLGNHDQALFQGAGDFNVIARGAIAFTVARLKPRGFFPGADKRARWRFLRDLPTTHKRGDLSFFHASPRDHVREYVLGSDSLVHREKMEAIFACFEGLSFIGHTHQPGIHGPAPAYRFHATTDPARATTSCFVPQGLSALVNVGSVGQPRDGDPRSCYVTVAPAKERPADVDFDLGGADPRNQGGRGGYVVRWHRVPYDVPRTMAKIRAQEGLHEVLARRLEVGK